MIDTSKLDTEYLVEFVGGQGAELAKAQTELIKNLGSIEGGGWTWHGFASCSEAVAVEDTDGSHRIVGAATQTSGVLLYFARKPVDLTIMPDGKPERGSNIVEGFQSRRARREAERKKR